MRLVCPNCAAQYEVDESVIPEMGRDVQCSNCGQMWFQPGKAAMAEAEAPAAATPEPDGWDIAGGWDAPSAEPAAEDTAEPAAEDTVAPVAEPPAMTDPAPAPEAEDIAEVAARPAAAPEAEDSTARSVSALISAFRAEQEPAADAQIEDLEEARPLSPAPQPGAQPRRTLDDSLLSILREEAEREARARRAEGSSIETQEELNLAPVEAPRPAPAAPAPKARSTPRPSPSPPPLRASSLPKRCPTRPKRTASPISTPAPNPPPPRARAASVCPISRKSIRPCAPPRSAALAAAL